MFSLNKLRQRFYAPNGYAEILRVGLPLVASMGSATVMQFTDRLFLSKYSVNAIAAALPAALASLTIMLTFLGLCSYSTVLIAQYVGAKAAHRVGIALWQGIWCAILCSILMGMTWWFAEPLFNFVGHAPEIRELEVAYFQSLAIGAGFCLLGASVGAFYSGRGRNRLVMLSSLLGAVVNIPLDYLLIFGGLGFPRLGIVGAGVATGVGWFVSFVFLAYFVFKIENEKVFKVRSAWQFDPEMFRRLLRFGLPSGLNLFLELVGTLWFIFEIGRLGTSALAASNIAFSINSLVFTPMLGLNMAVAALVGQAMGRKMPKDAEQITKNTLHIAIVYMFPFALLFMLFPEFLLNIFAPEGMSAEDFANVRTVGTVLLSYIAIYTLVDAGNIVYLGALKGVGDTVGIMLILICSMLFVLILPIVTMRHLGLISLHSYWLAFMGYVSAMAVLAHLRFWRRRWHKLKVIENV